MTSSDLDQRTSIWSVPEYWRRLYFAIFSAQILCLLGLAVWYEAFSTTESPWPETIFDIGRDVGSGVVAIAAESIALVEVVMIFTLMLEKYRKEQYRQYKEGEARERDRWEAWNQRRLEAEANNQPFTEPPPSQQFEETPGIRTR